MSYVVLARKWRPEHFDEVVGQGHVARTLTNSIEQDRVAHAYLFTGARGVGKTSTARILAKALNCKTGPTARPCYECSACKEISAGQSVDVFEIDGASNRGINEIRDLREGVRYSPSRDRYKVYIIDEVHMLTTEAFNALLKTLEEPPPHAIFVFATTEPQKIPVTILSRCQRFDFKRIGQKDIVDHLAFLCEQEGIEADRAALQIIARQAAGGMRDALSLLDQIISFAGKRISEEQIAEILGVANRKHLFELSEAVITRNAEQALLVLDEVNRYGYDLLQFASELVTHFRDLMVTAVVAQPDTVTQLTESEISMARAQVAQVPTELLHRYFSVIITGAQEMHRSPYPKLVFEMTLVRLARLEPLLDIDLMIDRLRALEGELEAGGVEKKKSEPPVISYEAVPAPRPAPVLGPEPTPIVADLPEPEPEPPAPTTPRVAKPLAPQRDPDHVAAPVEVSTLETLDQRWRFLVDHLRRENAPIAHLCEYAYPAQFGEDRVRLVFQEGHLELAKDVQRQALLQEIIQSLFGADYRLVLEHLDDAKEPASKTLAEEREENIRDRRAKLEQDMRGNTAILKAQKLFGTDELRVEVKLFDE